MTFRLIFIAANSSKEYEHKKEFTELRERLYPMTDRKLRWDKSERTLNNFLWHFKFELAFIECDINNRRKSIWEYNTGKKWDVK